MATTINFPTETIITPLPVDKLLIADQSSSWAAKDILMSGLNTFVRGASGDILLSDGEIIGKASDSSRILFEDAITVTALGAIQFNAPADSNVGWQAGSVAGFLAYGANGDMYLRPGETNGIVNFDSGAGVYVNGAQVLQMGSASSNCNVFRMIKGAYTGDPQVELALSADDQGDFSITADTGDIVLVSPTNLVFSPVGAINWTTGNVWYVPAGSGTDDHLLIESYITAATAGDTVVLAGGDNTSGAGTDTYVISDDIDIAQSINVVGQGIGHTTIACATASKNVFDITVDDVRIANLTIAMTGASDIGIVSTGAGTPLSGLIVDNVKITGATGATIIGMTLYDAGGTISNVVIENAGTGSSDGIDIRRVAANTDFTTNIYNSNIEATRDSLLCIGAVHCIVNTYNTVLSGATYDVLQATSGVVTLYDTTLVNNTTSGTITYGGTVVSDAFSDGTASMSSGTISDGTASIVGGKSTALNATDNTHSEAGDLLGILTAPVAIVGFTNATMAAAQTELGLENGAGRVWTYASTNAPSKTTQGNAYVYSPNATAGGYLTTPDTDDMSFDDSGTNPFSIGAWVEVVAGATNQTILGKWNSSNLEYLFHIGVDEKLWIGLYDQSVSKNPSCLSDAALSEGWHHIVMVYDSTGGATAADGITFYVDGVAVASTATNDASYVAMENLAATPMIGKQQTSTAYFQGDLGRLFVTAEELSAAQVWQLYSKTRGYYNM